MAETVPAQELAVTIRSYRPMDHVACRDLWTQFVEAHRRLFDDPSLGGDDPGAEFEDYLTRLNLSGMWVADHPEDGVVGFVGLLLSEQPGTAEVRPLIVDERYRRRGIGRALIHRVAEEARNRPLRTLTISPAARNVEAIRSLHAAGYTALASLTLALDIRGQSRKWRDGIDVHGLRFSY